MNEQTDQEYIISQLKKGISLATSREWSELSSLLEDVLDTTGIMYEGEYSVGDYGPW